MRAAVFRGVGRMPVEEVPDPRPGPRDIVLAVRACGVCGTDLSSYTKGLFVHTGQIMGHEFAGEVVHVGEQVSGIALGDRLTGLPIQPCGQCRRCLTGAGHLCEIWGTRSIAYGLPGAFAELLRVPDAVLGGNVHRLPDNVSVADGALVEPLAVGVHAVRRAGHRAGQPAVVFGLGPIGVRTAQVLLAHGASPVIGVDGSPLRRTVAAGLGVATLDGTGDLGAAIRDLAAVAEIPTVFEASGAPSLARLAVEVVRPGGTVMVVALYDAPVPVDATLVVQKELVLRGSAMVTPEDFRDAIGLLASMAVTTQPLVTQRERLEHIDRAFAVQLDRAVAMKVLITP